MKILYFALPAIAAVITVPIAVNAAANREFNAVVSAVEQRYASHAERIPLMGLANFCAWAATGGGVRGIRIAEFDHLSTADPAELEAIVRKNLGRNWQPFVTDRNRSGNITVIYVEPDGAAMRMMVADLEHGELDLVRLEVNGDRLRQWMRDPQGRTRHHDYAGITPD